jgi:hypothetical protein
MLLSSFLQSGGLKQIRHHSPSSKQKEKSPLQAIEDMLKSPGATFEVLTCSSLKGFMFTLTVRHEHSEFFKQLKPGGRFDEPETEFIVKFCITSNDEYGIDKFKFKQEKGVDKETETDEGFFEEAKLQQDIWSHSISAGKEPLCPSVGAFQILKHSRALTFLSGLSPAVGKTLCTTPKSQYTIDFLFKQISNFPPSSSSSPEFKLGILLMSKIPNSTTLEAYLKMHSGTAQSEDARMHVKSMMLAKVIRLFIEGKAVHFDFHPGNGMVILDQPSGELEGTIVIDFGRASSLQNPKADGYLNPDEKKQFLELIDGPPGARSMSSRSKTGPNPGIGYYDECLYYCMNMDRSTPVQRAEYLSRVLKVIIDVEHAKSQAKFHDPKDPTGYPVERYQTQWVEELFEHGQTRATGFSIQQRWAEVTFEELCRTLVVKPASSCSALGDSCLQFKSSDSAATYTSRGGAKLKTSKKSRKSKKTRKQRKSRKIRRSRKSKR